MIPTKHNGFCKRRSGATQAQPDSLGEDNEAAAWDLESQKLYRVIGHLYRDHVLMVADIPEVWLVTSYCSFMHVESMGAAHLPRLSSATARCHCCDSGLKCAG